MSGPQHELHFFEDPSPADRWDEKSAQRALDDLFNATFAYRSSSSYFELMQFIACFRFYSPYNAMLLGIQRPGARFVAPAARWQREYGRRVKPEANPLVILQPMGPVMFVFDVADTEGDKLPPEVENPFEVRGGHIRSELEETLENVKRDGIRVHGRKIGSQQAGSIRPTRSTPADFLEFPRSREPRDTEKVQVHYEVDVNLDLSPEARYATLVHELAHLYCGHLGTPNEKWWPDRQGLLQGTEEFEAESVAFLVCSRLGIDSPSDQYLAGYTQEREQVPPISLECVVKSAGLIESMGRQHLKPRKARDDAWLSPSRSGTEGSGASKSKES